MDDAGGNPLVETTAAGDVTVYAGSQEVTSRAGVVSGVRRFYGIGGRVVASRTITAATGSSVGAVFVGANTQGTPTVSWDPAAPATSWVRRQFFDPFGVNLAVGGVGNPVVAGSLATGGFGTGHGFLDKPGNPDTGVVSVGARKYDPVNGVFLSPDPVLDPGDPGSWNAFGYTAGNPVTYSDPSGLYAKYDEGGGVGSQYTTGNGDWTGTTGGGSGKTSTDQRPTTPNKPKPSGPTSFKAGSDAYLHGGSAARFLKPTGIPVGFQPLPRPRPKPAQTLGTFSGAAAEESSGWGWIAPVTKVVGGVVLGIALVAACPETAGATCVVAAGFVGGVASQCMSDCSNGEELAAAGVIGMVPLGGPAKAAANPFRVAAESGAPLIKAGSEGGETAGKVFSRSVKNDVLTDNPSTCVYCRMETDRPQVDHVIPRSRGGNATLENAQTCGWCNASKGARDFPVNPPPGYRGMWPPEWWGLP